jgi:hypothetical protein
MFRFVTVCLAAAVIFTLYVLTAEEPKPSVPVKTESPFRLN